MRDYHDAEPRPRMRTIGVVAMGEDGRVYIANLRLIEVRNEALTGTSTSQMTDSEQPRIRWSDFLGWPDVGTQICLWARLFTYDIASYLEYEKDAFLIE